MAKISITLLETLCTPSKLSNPKSNTHNVVWLTDACWVKLTSSWWIRMTPTLTEKLLPPVVCVCAGPSCCLWKSLLWLQSARSAYGFKLLEEHSGIREAEWTACIMNEKLNLEQTVECFATYQAQGQVRTANPLIVVSHYPDENCNNHHVVWPYVYVYVCLFVYSSPWSRVFLCGLCMLPLFVSHRWSNIPHHQKT